MNPIAEQIIVNILNEELNLPADHCWIRNQNKVIPPFEDLFIVVGMTDSKVIGNDNILNAENLTETQNVITIDNIQIDMLSRNLEALTRRWEVIAALQSYYSEQLQEKYNFRIYQIPHSFTNTSFAEGGSQLNRYTIVIPCQVWYSKIK